jgi:hypothetical protein
MTQNDKIKPSAHGAILDRDAGKGGAGGHRLPCPLVRGQWGGGGESALIDKNSHPKKYEVQRLKGMNYE